MLEATLLIFSVQIPPEAALRLFRVHRLPVRHLPEAAPRLFRVHHLPQAALWVLPVRRLPEAAIRFFRVRRLPAAAPLLLMQLSHVDDSWIPALKNFLRSARRAPPAQVLMTFVAVLVMRHSPVVAPRL